MNRIYYFTGMGNTLHAAKDEAELIGDTELVRIQNYNYSIINTFH